MSLKRVRFVIVWVVCRLRGGISLRGNENKVYGFLNVKVRCLDF